MECYRKKDVVWRRKDGLGGVATVRCGRCIPCLITNSEEWALRCSLEAEMHEECCCLTLTIENEFLSEKFSEGVSRREIQLFIKRLRNFIEPNKVRYFGCGEYGSLKGRPHYHVAIFGWVPPDGKFFKLSRSGNKMYVSHQLSGLWPYGYALYEEFDERAAAYCSKYLNKIKEPIKGLNAPFTFMSLKPSIGFPYLSNRLDLFERGYIYYKGRKRVIPRSFYQSLKRQGIEFPELAEKRKEYVELIDDDERFVKEKNSLYFSQNILDKLHFL